MYRTRVLKIFLISGHLPFSARNVKTVKQVPYSTVHGTHCTEVMFTQRCRTTASVRVSISGHFFCTSSSYSSVISSAITGLGLPGTRDRGRPRKMWSACVRNDMTICNLDGVNPLDRNSCRTSVRRCPESGTTSAP